MRIFAISAAAFLLVAADGPPQVSVLQADFLWQQIQANGTLLSRSSTHIPYEPDRSCYRWLLRVKPGPGIVTIDERLEVPGEVSDFGDAGGLDSPTKIDPDHRAATTSLTFALAKGVIGNTWCVADGDPRGHYRIKVSQGTKMLHQFDFTVEEAAPSS
jgi:hypothetical protein